MRSCSFSHFEHQPANTPYRAGHAIYVRRIAAQAFEGVLLAVRAFDAGHMMIDAEVCEGTRAAEMFDRFLSSPQTSYLQVHNARRGCYAARVERARGNPAAHPRSQMKGIGTQ